MKIENTFSPTEPFEDAVMGASATIRWALMQGGLSGPERRTLFAVVGNFLISDGMAPAVIEDAAGDVSGLPIPIALTAARWLVVRGVLREGRMHGLPAYWPTCPRLPVPTLVLGQNPRAFAGAVAQHLPQVVADDSDLPRAMAELIWNGCSPEVVREISTHIVAAGESLQSAADLVAAIQARLVLCGDDDLDEDGQAAPPPSAE